MQPVFLQQRLYPTLQLGFKPTVTHSKYDVSVHVRQSDLDSACGLHAATMALILMGKITHARSLPKRRRGVAARLWQAAQETYFDGIDEIGLADMLEALNANLQINHYEGTHKKTLEFTKAELEHGGVVILSWQTKDRETHHWVLALGVEGMLSGRTFTPTALLVMDPGLSEPLMCGYNARLQLTSRPIPGRVRYVSYVSNDGTSLPVMLTGGVAIRDASK